MKDLKGKTVIITAVDNESYGEFLNKELTIISCSNKGHFYDKAMYPEMLCDLKVKGTKELVPFALYEYEFKIISIYKDNSDYE